MKRYLAVFAAVVLACVMSPLPRGSAQAQQPAAAPNPCVMPTQAAATPAQTAWQLFVAINCKAPNGQLVWETWIEQLDLYPASGTATAAATTHKRLHGSPLAQAVTAKLAGAPQLQPSQECGKMKAPPSNVVNTIICEEARLSPTAASYITAAGNGYQVRSGQTAAAKAGKNIQFPTSAVEVKVDWIPASDYNPPFTCTSPPQGVYTETIDGTCYALAGMHISSKLLPNWLWATFEPQSMLTNPNRCITFGPCNDPWGSSPATSSGGASGFTQQTQALSALMKQANLAPVFANYRMDGVQTTFGTTANPTLLGNSVIEGYNVGMAKGTASCITCHSVSSIKNDGTDAIFTLGSPVGPKYVVPAGWIGRDFAWSMAVACPNGIQACTSTAPR
jgi:hypothetical protein